MTLSGTKKFIHPNHHLIESIDFRLMFMLCVDIYIWSVFSCIPPENQNMTIGNESIMSSGHGSLLSFWMRRMELR